MGSESLFHLDIVIGWDKIMTQAGPMRGLVWDLPIVKSIGKTAFAFEFLELDE